MSSLWESPVAIGSSARSSFDSNATPIPSSSTPAKSSLSTSPTNPSPLHQRKDDHAHRKRNRIVLSCVQCRRRKLKCDRQFPCGACTRRGAADECFYQRHDKGRLEDSGVLERRMETLEKLVRGLVGETALQQIKDGSFELNRDGNTSSGEDTVPLQRSTTGGESGPETLDNLNLAMGQLTILPESEGGTLYAGGTAWDAVFAQFAELKQLLKQARDQGGGIPEASGHMAVYSDRGSNIQWMPAESFHSHADDEIVGANQQFSCFPFNNCAPPSMAEVLLLLPSKPLMQKLLDKFFSSLLPFNKIVHYHTFIKEYKDFQKAPEEAKPSWIALLFTLLSSALMSYSPTFFASINDTGLSHEQVGKRFQSGAKAALVHAQFLRSHTLSVIQALVLLQLSVNPEDMAVSSWALHGATKNLALQMGLHREPSLFKIPEPEAEIRRRVWWCIYIQDRLSCVNHGIAVSWQDSDADCREPIICEDDQLNAPDFGEKRHTYRSGTDAPFCAMTIFYCQMNLAKILTHVIQIAFGLKRTNYSKILKLDDEVENFRRHVLPKVLIRENPGYDKNLEPIAMIMRCFYLKAILLLHRPFIGRSHENSQFRWSRDRAVQAALTISRNSVALFTSTNILLENHFAANPMLAHGLFPAPVALALDLYTWPDQPDPEPSRQALIDMRRVYLSLSTKFIPMKRLYKILNVLMGKAWEKAGLTLPVEELPSRMGSLSSSNSTPSPTMGNYDMSSKKWGPQGLVPTSLQQFNPAQYTNQTNPGYDWTSANPGMVPTNLMNVGTSNPVTWDPNNFPLFGSPNSSTTQPYMTPQFNETYDLENNGVWNQTEWDLFVNSMDLDPVVNGTSLL